MYEKWTSRLLCLEAIRYREDSRWNGFTIRCNHLSIETKPTLVKFGTIVYQMYKCCRFTHNFGWGQCASCVDLCTILDGGISNCGMGLQVQVIKKWASFEAGQGRSASSSIQGHDSKASQPATRLKERPPFSLIMPLHFMPCVCTVPCFHKYWQQAYAPPQLPMFWESNPYHEFMTQTEGCQFYPWER